MGGRVGRVDEEIIHVDDEPSFCNHVMKGIIHEVLEGGRGISETEEHHGWFEESFMGDESSFPLMSILDSDIIISPLDTKLVKIFAPWSLLTRSEMSGRGYASWTVCSLM